ncbi:MAG: hypothetical protein R3Y11_00420 [Pseudomonadota bacterium]
MEQVKFYVRQVLIGIDQLGNTLLGGWADETLSSRAGRLGYKCKKWRFVRDCIDCLFFWDYEKIDNTYTMRHCELAYLNELERQQCPPEARQGQARQE